MYFLFCSSRDYATYVNVIDIHILLLHWYIVQILVCLHHATLPG